MHELIWVFILILHCIEKYIFLKSWVFELTDQKSEFERVS